MFERTDESPWYTIQVDKSTNVTNKATVLASVQYIFQQDVLEDMLCALLSPTNSTATELCKSLSHYTSGKLNWPFCVSLCTNREADMTEWLSGSTT